MLGSPEYRKYVQQKRQEHEQLFTQAAAGLPALTNRDAAAPDVYAAIRAAQLAAQNGESLEFSAPPAASFSIIADANGVRDVEDTEPAPEYQEGGEAPPRDDESLGLEQSESAPVDDGVSQPDLGQEPASPESPELAPPDEPSQEPVAASDVESNTEPPELSSEPIGDVASPDVDSEPDYLPSDISGATSQINVGLGDASGVEDFDYSPMAEMERVEPPSIEEQGGLPIENLQPEVPRQPVAEPRQIPPAAPQKQDGGKGSKRGSQKSRKTTVERMAEKLRSLRSGLLPRQVKGEAPIEEIEKGAAEGAPPPIPFLHGDRQAAEPAINIPDRLGDPGVNDADRGTTPDEIEPALDYLSITADQTSARLGDVLIEIAEFIEDLNGRLTIVEKILDRSRGA